MTDKPSAKDTAMTILKYAPSGTKAVTLPALELKDLCQAFLSQAEELREARSVIEWYADGLFPGDESQVGSAFRVGKRARAFLSKHSKEKKDEFKKDV